MRGRPAAVTLRDVMWVKADGEIEGLWRVSSEENWPRPWALVVGALHGNEPCGLDSIDTLLSQARNGQLGDLAGTLFLLHGNPRASAEGTRFSTGGTDLNRLFDFGFEHTLNVAHWTYEHHRAAALRPLLAQIDAALDLHSSSRPTPPFAIAGELPASQALASRLGLPYAVRGWSGPGMLGDRVLLAPLDARGVPSVAVECGQHEEAEASAHALRTALEFLVAAGLRSPAAQPSAPTKTRWLRLHDAIRKPSHAFRFERPLNGFETLQPGQCIGRDGLLSLQVQQPCVTVMPNDEVDPGGDMLYLALDDGEH